MRTATIIKLIFAILVGIAAAIATYDFVTNPHADHGANRNSDSPGPLF
jgi:hypothetical protein